MTLGTKEQVRKRLYQLSKDIRGMNDEGDFQLKDEIADLLSVIDRGDWLRACWISSGLVDDLNYLHYEAKRIRRWILAMEEKERNQNYEEESK